jgi:radical SAM superfamily enzyme YgiQ (UPF0313 family)
MKVLLVQPPTHSKLGLQAFMLPEPLGLEAVAGSLIHEHEVRILDMRLDPSLRQEITSFKPDAVGVAASFTSDVYGVYHILEIIRDYDPRIKTFVGGQHATMAHRDFFGRADTVVLGEGELTTPEVLRSWEEGRPLHEVAGLAFRCEDSWVQSEPRPLTQNLDETPAPARYLTSKYHSHYFIGSRRPCASLEISRGCPYRCKFCSVWRFYRGSYRSRSPERAAQELAQIESKDVFFTDDNALAQPSSMEKLLQQVEKMGLKKHYLAQLRADSIVKCRSLLARWRNIGLETVFVGFESITQRGLDKLDKRLSVDYIKEAIKTLREFSISVMGSFVVSPDFGREDFAALRRFVSQMKLPTPIFSILTPLPGTVLYEEKAPEITSRNYELYDLLHSVLPTRLGLKKFYQEYIRLNLSYFTSITPDRLIKRLNPWRLVAFFKEIWAVLKVLKDNHPEAMVRHHQLPPGKLSEKRFTRQD